MIIRKVLVTIPGIIISLLALVLLAWVYWPVHQQIETVVISHDQLAGVSQQGVVGRVIRLVYPESVRIGEKGNVFLEVLPNPGSSQVSDSVMPPSTVEALARLEIPGVILKPEDLTSTSLIPGRTAHFQWQLAPTWSGMLRGQAWFYLKFYPEASSEPIEKTISAQPFRISVQDTLGIPLLQMKIIGWAALLSGALILSVKNHIIGLK